MPFQTRITAAALLGSALALVLPVCALADNAGPADIRAKDTFAVVWERLQNSGFKGQHEGLDWAALKAKHQPDIEAARDIHGLRREINELLADLKASHLMLLPAETLLRRTDDDADDIKVSAASDDRDAPSADAAAAGAADADPPRGHGDLGLRLTLAEGKLLVERVVPGSPAAAAGIRPGWSVERIGHFDSLAAVESMRTLPADALRRSETLLLMQATAALDDTRPGRTLALRFRDFANKPRTVAPTAVANAGIQTVTLPGIPPIPMRYGHRRIELPDGGCALYVEFTVWSMPAFDRMVESLREHGDCRGAVLDLRGNIGGLAASLSAVGGLFLDRPASLGTLSTRDGDLKLTALPRVVDEAGRDIRRFSGPLAILIDRASISCSDIFPASMQALGRARIFGVTSAGMALPAASVPLPSGDRLMYPIADFVDPAGRRIEGVGAIPDQIVTPTPAALAAGGDPILDAALAWIGTNPEVALVADPASSSHRQD